MDLLQWDYYLFELLNQQWTNGFLDGIMPYWRSKYFWMPLYLFILSYMIYQRNREWLIFSLCMILTIALADQLSSSWIKPAIERLRPCNNPIWKDQVHLLVRCGSGFSFTSSHATNHFALATFWAFPFVRYRWVLPLGFLWAATISYGQVYVGVHYPLDVMAGGLVGILIGVFTGWIFLLISRYRRKKHKESIDE